MAEAKPSKDVFNHQVLGVFDPPSSISYSAGPRLLLKAKRLETFELVASAGPRASTTLKLLGSFPSSAVLGSSIFASH